MKASVTITMFALSMIVAPSLIFAQGPDSRNYQIPPTDGGSSLKTESPSIKHDTPFARLPDVPSIINGSNFSPFESNVSLNPSQSDIAVKICLLSQDSFHTGNIKKLARQFSGYANFDIKASNGVATLFNSASPPANFSFDLGVSKLFKNRALNDKNQKVVWGWMNLTGNMNYGNYNIINQNASYNTLILKQTSKNGGIFLSMNTDFLRVGKSNWVHSNSWHKNHSLFVSIKTGYEWTDNYANLPQVNANSVQNSFLSTNGTQYQTLSTSVAGAEGVLRHYGGAYFDFEMYYNLNPKTLGKKNQYRNDSAPRRSSIDMYLGYIESNYWASDSTFQHINFGLFINVNGGSSSTGSSGKIGISLTGQFSEVFGYNPNGTYFQPTDANFFNNYFKNWSWVLQTTIPINFLVKNGASKG